MGEKILKRVGKDNVREAYAVGVALEDNLNQAQDLLNSIMETLECSYSEYHC